MRESSPARFEGQCAEWDAHPTCRQASLAAWFSTFADRHRDLDLLVQEVCAVAAVGVRARFAGLLQFRMDQKAFVLQASTGWHESLLGSWEHTADLTTTAGVAWHTGQLVHFRNLRLCDRIRSIGPMKAAGVYRVLSVPIIGKDGEGFGILEVGSADTGEFSIHDKSFLRKLVGSLEAALALAI